MTTSKISVFLRGATDELSKVLRDNGFLTVAPEREQELAAILEKFNEEMYGAPSSSSPRRKQTDVRVMSETPVVYDRDYLTKQSVQELLRIAKAKGCKNLGPRKKESLIEKLLLHLTAPLAIEEADQSNSEPSSQTSEITAATDDELRPEPVPAAPTVDEAKEKKPRKKKESIDEPALVVPTGDAPEPAKKQRKKKEKSDDESSQVVSTGDAPEPAKKERKKKEKSDDESKPKAERKKKTKEPVTEAEEKQEKEEEEVTIAVRSWIHPKEQDKPPAERTRYCIDPITNNIYNPDQLTDEPVGRWDDETQEIIPF
jgi:hypothetical protein